jgi:hypothetical protein
MALGDRRPRSRRSSSRWWSRGASTGRRGRSGPARSIESVSFAQANTRQLHRGTSRGATRARLRRRPQCHHRVPVHRREPRRPSGPRGGAGAAEGRCDRGVGGSASTCRPEGDQVRAGGVRWRDRSRRARARRQPDAAGREHHRDLDHALGPRRQTTGALEGAGPRPLPNRGPVATAQSEQPHPAARGRGRRSHAAGTDPVVAGRRPRRSGGGVQGGAGSGRLAPAGRPTLAGRTVRASRSSPTRAG